jgi:hypothetical protein
VVAGVAVTAVVVTYAVSTAAAATGAVDPLFPPPLLPGVKTVPEGDVAIRINPASLSCTEKGCDSPVTVESVGSLPLHITTIAFDGSGASNFNQTSDCVGKWLGERESCTVKVSFAGTASGTRQTARLVIHQTYPAIPRTSHWKVPDIPHRPST